MQINLLDFGSVVVKLPFYWLLVQKLKAKIHAGRRKQGERSKWINNLKQINYLQRYFSQLQICIAKAHQVLNTYFYSFNFIQKGNANIQNCFQITFEIYPRRIKVDFTVFFKYILTFFSTLHGCWHILNLLPPVSPLFQTLLGLSQHTDIYLLNDMDSEPLAERQFGSADGGVASEDRVQGTAGHRPVFLKT